MKSKSMPKLVDLLTNGKRKSLKESAKRGEMVSFTSDGVKWYMTYIDSSHIKLNDAPNMGIGSAVYHMKQLEKKSYYADMVKWMDTGNTKLINGKRY